jgi:hypothetical protein
MAHAVDILRTGAWLTGERVKLVVFGLLAASLIAAVYVVATSDGLNDHFGRPLGTDFSNVYAAGTYVLDGNAAAPFDPPRQYAREQAIFGADTQFYGWHYPPYFLGLAALFAAMPYALALALWQGVTFALYLWATWAILSTGRARALADPLWLPLVIGFPAVFVNLGHGHNGFLTAALFGAALLQLDRKPVLAGVLFGCMAYKPQFGLHVCVRSRYLERVSRLDQVHARRRARAGRNRLAQDSERLFRRANVGWRNFARLCRPGRGHACRGRRARLAVAQPSLFPDQGGGARDRHNPRNALQPRLRSYAARASHCVPCRRRDAAWFPPVAKIPAGSAMARADSGPPGCAGDTDPACGPRDVSGFCVDAAARNDPDRRKNALAFRDPSAEVK